MSEHLDLTDMTCTGNSVIYIAPPTGRPIKKQSPISFPYQLT